MDARQSGQSQRRKLTVSVLSSQGTRTLNLSDMSNQATASWSSGAGRVIVLSTAEVKYPPVSAAWLGSDFVFTEPYLDG